jgi:oxalate decarboxylase/phosphoglucose isomerase-like protein (cupin superfamily)
MDAQPIVVRPGEGHRVGNVEFLARTVDTPRFTFGIIEIAPGRVLEPHVHDGEDDAFYIVEGEMTFTFGDDEVAAPPGTFSSPRPASSTASATTATGRCGCSTSTRRPGSTAASACPTDLVSRVPR